MMEHQVNRELPIEDDDDLPDDVEFDSEEYKAIQKKRDEYALRYFERESFSDKRLPNSGEEFNEKEFIKRFQKFLDDAEDAF